METYLNNFLTYLELEINASPLTIESYRRELRRFFSVCNITHPRKITETSVQALRVALHQEQISPKTLKHYLNALRTFLKYLREQKLDVYDYTLVKLPKVGKHIPDVMTLEEAKKILQANKDRALDSAILYTIYTTACRISEIATLPIKLQLDSDNGYKVRGKGNKDRVVYFGAEAIVAVRSYIATRTDNDPRLFPISVENIKARVRQCAKRAGYKGRKYGPHGWRHLAATEMYKNSPDLLALQDYLGHESPETTKIYAKITNAQTKRLHTFLPALA